MENNLSYVKKTVYEKAGPEVVKEAYAYAEDYKKFLDASKTEREAVVAGVKIAEKGGYTPYTFGEKLKVGDKKYYVNRGKNLFLFKIGSESINNGIRITAAHIDSPRLDLKQMPLVEHDGMAYFKTRYYGGIRKYQWLARPLALHGVIVKKDGTVVDVCIGENDNDPLFYITDLLPHLASKDASKNMNDLVPGERLNILLGSQPLEGEEKAAVKANVLQYLSNAYGVCEEDFLSAELCLVPSEKARDIGLDRSMIGGYGHDDRCCAYPSLTAIIDADESVHTTMCILVDKEEIGSEGVSGMQNDFLVDLMEEIAVQMGGKGALCRMNSKCFSSDVAANYDPDFADVFEKQNAAIPGCGITVCKFTGVRGKGGTSDASAEMVAFTRKTLDDAGVVWQLAELGKNEAGGGGTVAKFIADHNIDTIDIGVGVTSMHSPYEMITKVDLYEGYRAFKAFYKA